MYYHHFYLSVQCNATDENIDNMVHCESFTNVTDDFRFYAESAETADAEKYFSACFEVFAPSFDAVPGATLLSVFPVEESMYQFITKRFPYIVYKDGRIDFDLTYWEFSIRNSKYQLVVRNSEEL